MKKLIIMVAAPGSGKSYWIQAHKDKLTGTVKVVSRDAIRFALVKENEEYFSKENEVFKTYINEIKDGLNTCDITIADATHLNEASRTKLLRALGSSLNGVEVDAIQIKVSLDTALRQNDNRVNTRSFVPKSVIHRMYMQLTTPSFDEGFDKIFLYQPDKDVKYIILERDNHGL